MIFNYNSVITQNVRRRPEPAHPELVHLRRELLDLVVHLVDALLDEGVCGGRGWGGTS